MLLRVRMRAGVHVGAVQVCIQRSRLKSSGSGPVVASVATAAKAGMGIAGFGSGAGAGVGLRCSLSGSAGAGAVKSHGIAHHCSIVSAPIERSVVSPKRTSGESSYAGNKTPFTENSPPSEKRFTVPSANSNCTLSAAALPTSAHTLPSLHEIRTYALPANVRNCAVPS